jgi:caffeoyl-CoA O-methyltransferase
MMNPMIEKPQAYFKQWIPSRSELLHSLELEAQNEQIPIIGPVVGQLLYILACIRKPTTILELGTAIGYSTIYLAQACNQWGGRVVSFEISPPLLQRAKINIAKAGLSHCVEICEDNAIIAMRQMQLSVDMIFMDIEKEDYISVLPLCGHLLTSGGLLLVDNTGFQGAHTFNAAIYNSDELESVNIYSFLPGHSPEYDALCIALKR